MLALLLFYWDVFLSQVHHIGDVDYQKTEFGPIRTLIIVNQNFNYMPGVN